MPCKRVCAFKGCGATSSKINKVSFFIFPKNEELFHKWAFKSGCFDLIGKNLHWNRIRPFLCDKHFRPEDIDGHLGAVPYSLRRGAIPSTDSSNLELFSNNYQLMSDPFEDVKKEWPLEDIYIKEEPLDPPLSDFIPIPKPEIKPSSSGLNKMKRKKMSGAAFRKIRKLKEEEAANRNENSLLQLVRQSQREENETTAEVPEVVLTETEGEAPDAVVEDVVERDKENYLLDIGLWPAKIDHSIRDVLLLQGSRVVQHMDCEFKGVARPGTKTKGATRKLSRNWFFQTLQNGEKSLRVWMMYSPFKEAVFCFCCRLFPTGNSSFNSVEGFKNWWKLNPKIHEHESSPAHTHALIQWKELEIQLVQGKLVERVEQEMVENETKKWQQSLTRFLDVIRILANQNLASLIGHQDFHDDAENKGNLVRVALEEKFTTSYISPKIQNEFVNILGDQIRKKIIEQVKQSKYFCIIFDGTPSDKGQMSQVLRYVKMDGKEVKVEESFLRFIEIEGKNDEQIAAIILEQLEKDDIQIQDCRGLAFDNAVVMAGHQSGVQKRIREVNQKALFIPSLTNHSLNLAGVNAASLAVDSVIFFGTLDRVFSFFSASTHRWDILIATTGQAIERVAETRWSSRVDAVNFVQKNISEVVAALEQLTDEVENATTRSDAGLILYAILSFPFLSFLGLWNAVLPEINNAQKYLQTKGLDLQHCAVNLLALKVALLQNRDKTVDDAIIYSKGSCSKLGISMERRILKKKRMDCEGSGDALLGYEAELRRDMLSVLDRLIDEISSRFEHVHGLSEKYDFLTPSNLLDKGHDCQLDDVDEDIVKVEFFIERERLQLFVAAIGSEEMECPLQILQFIQSYNLCESLPNIFILLRVFLTRAIGVVNCERSFSKLKLINNYHEAAMSQARLTDLAILSIERDLAEEIDFDGVINDFAERKARRINL